MAMKFVAEKFGKKFSRDNKRTIVKLGLNGTVETKTFDEFAGIKDGKKSTKGYSKKDLIKYFKT